MKAASEKTSHSHADVSPHLQAVFITLPCRCSLEMLGGQEHLRGNTVTAGRLVSIFWHKDQTAIGNIKYMQE